MTIQAPVSSPPVPVAAAPVALAPGDRIDARVVGPGADGLVRLATAAGLIDADLPPTLPAGSRASFIVQSVGAQLTLSLIAAVAPDPAVAAASEADASASVPDNARLAVLQAVRQAALAGQDGPAPLLALIRQLDASTAVPGTLREAAATLSGFGVTAEQLADPEGLAAAVSRSGLFGEARAAAGRPAVADLKVALATVLATAMAWKPGAGEAPVAAPLSSTPDGPDQPQTTVAAAPSAPAAAGKTAVAGMTAGVVSPYPPAEGGQAPSQTVRADAPALRTIALPSGPASAKPPGSSTPVPEARTSHPGGAALAAASPAAGNATPSDPAAAVTGMSAEKIAGPVPSKIVPGDTTSEGRAIIGPVPGSRPDTTRRGPDDMPSSLGQDGPPSAAKPFAEAPRPGAALALLAQLMGRDLADAPASPGALAEPTPGRSAPPQADRAPVPSRPVPDRTADLRPDMPAGVLRATVIERTEAVLDRIVLSQLASLPAEVSGQPTAASQQGAPNASQNGPAQSWVMDLPLRLSGETAAAQLRVSRDGGRGAEGVDAPKGWTVEFALDTTVTGPVHARLRLGGPVLGVTLWAERPATLAALQDAAPDLRRALDEAAFSVETISVLAGAPRPPRPTRPGSLVDARS